MQVVIRRFSTQLDGLIVAPGDHVLVNAQAVLDEGEDDAADASNLAHGGDVHVVVLARVDLAADRLLHAVDGGGLGGGVALDVLADPDVAVDAEQDVDLAGGVGGVHGPDLALGADDAAAAAGARDGDEDAVAQLAVLEAARVQAGGAVLVQLLHLGHDEVALGEEAANLQLVRLGTLAQDAAGQVDGRDLQHRQLRRRHVDAPPLGLHLDNAPDDEVANLGRVASAQGPHREELVGLGERAC